MPPKTNEIAPQLDPTELENHATGMAKLEALGLAHLGDIHVDAGDLCKGSLAQFIGDVRHARVADQVVATAEVARASGKDVEESVMTPLAFFVKKDEKGDLLRVEIPKIEPQKKTFLNLNIRSRR